MVPDPGAPPDGRSVRDPGRDVRGDEERDEIKLDAARACERIAPKGWVGDSKSDGPAWVGPVGRPSNRLDIANQTQTADRTPGPLFGVS